MDRIRETLHRAPEERAHDAKREHAMAALEVAAQAPAAGASALEQLYDLLDGCGLDKLFHPVHHDLGVDAGEDVGFFRAARRVRVPCAVERRRRAL